MSRLFIIAVATAALCAFGKAPHAYAQGGWQTASATGYSFQLPSTPSPQSALAPSSTMSAITSSASGAILQVSGSGDQDTQNFSVPASWQVHYSYDCSAFGLPGNFIVKVYNADGSPSLNNPNDINQISLRGSGTQSYHLGGSYYLEISSECNWSIAVAAGS